MRLIILSQRIGSWCLCCSYCDAWSSSSSSRNSATIIVAGKLQPPLEHHHDVFGSSHNLCSSGQLRNQLLKNHIKTLKGWGEEIPYVYITIHELLQRMIVASCLQAPAPKKSFRLSNRFLLNDIKTTSHYKHLSHEPTHPNSVLTRFDQGKKECKEEAW
jgi:hypothetical protein